MKWFDMAFFIVGYAVTVAILHLLGIDNEDTPVLVAVCWGTFTILGAIERQRGQS